MCSVVPRFHHHSARPFAEPTFISLKSPGISEIAPLPPAREERILRDCVACFFRDISSLPLFFSLRKILIPEK